jgi:hypothetical protein
MSNYNQQYSRKFNIKIMNYPENKDEKIRDIFVKDIAVVRTLRNLAVFGPMFEWSETQERPVLNTIVH